MTNRVRKEKTSVSGGAEAVQENADLLTPQECELIGDLCRLASWGVPLSAEPTALCGLYRRIGGRGGRRLAQFMRELAARRQDARLGEVLARSVVEARERQVKAKVRS